MEYTKVGKIINTHGIKGEVKIYPLTENIKRFTKGMTLYLGDSKEELLVKTIRYIKGLPIISFVDHEDINLILKYKDEYLYVDDKDRISLPENFYFIYDLLNSRVTDMEDKEIGILVNVLQGPRNDVYIIKSPCGKKEYMVPAVGEFVKLVDTVNKLIKIDPIDGMIE